MKRLKWLIVAAVTAALPAFSALADMQDKVVPGGKQSGNAGRSRRWVDKQVALVDAQAWESL